MFLFAILPDMAELTYNDVRRAAQEAVKELQNIVNGLKINSEDIRRGVQETSGSQNRLNDLTQRLDTLQNQINNLDSNVRNHNNSINILQTMQQNLNDLHQRMINSEDLIRFVYNYFTAEQQLQRRRERGEF